MESAVRKAVKAAAFTGWLMVEIELFLVEELYLEKVKTLLRGMLGDFFLENNLEKLKHFLEESLPLVKNSDLRLESNQTTLNLILLCKKREGAGTFFYDLTSRWLMPGKKRGAKLFFIADFRFKFFEEEFTLAEVVLPLESRQEKEEALKNLRVILTEIKLGVASDFHASRILQFKGLPYDRKTTLIQEKIASLIQSHSKDFGKSILSHMQHFLVTCSEEFKTQRDYHHISRIISVLFFMQGLLKQKLAAEPERRHILVKFLKTKVLLGESVKEVLGVIVGLNFLKEHEVFEKKHLISALKEYVPLALDVPSSYFLEKDAEMPIQTLYLEIEKENGLDFTSEEVNLLRLKLSEQLKGHIELLQQKVFMPRNEEEIVRSIVALSRQLKYVQDLPQVVISFDEQIGSELCFNIVLLRVLRLKAPTILELFGSQEGGLKFVLDRVKKVGVIRRKYLKEANVFRLFLKTEHFLRPDHSVDLNRARLAVMEYLNRVLGEVRDYNGGLIYKQNEAYQNLVGALGEMEKKNLFLLEKFFFAIRPSEMAATVATAVLKSLFFMFLNAIKREEARIKKHSDYLFKKEKNALYLILPCYDFNLKKALKEKIALSFLSSLLSFELAYNEITYLGFILFSDDEIKTGSFLKLVQGALTFELASG